CVLCLSIAARKFGLEADYIYKNELLFTDYEPERVYPLLTSLPLSNAEYSIEAGNIGQITEKEFNMKFGLTVIIPYMNLFTNANRDSVSPYRCSQQVNLDPRLYGKKPVDVHFGIDMTTGDPRKENTIFINPIRAKYLGKVDGLARLSPETPVTRVVDYRGNDLDVTIDNYECGVIMLYAHLLPWLNSSKIGEIIEVGSPIGDITKNLKIGGSSSPHVHIEMIAIPLYIFEDIEKGRTTLENELKKENYSPKKYFIRIDSTAIWKHFNADVYTKTGIRSYYWEITKSAE